MESDRAANLTVKSAVAGIIDYSKADWFDPMWWKRWRYLVTEMEQKTQIKLKEIIYNYYLALMSNSMLSSDDFSKMQKKAKELFNEIDNAEKPWAAKSRESVAQQEELALRQQLEKALGFELTNKEALNKWHEDARKAFAEQGNSSENDKNEEKLRLFNQRVAEIKNKRIKQQGRK